MLAPDYLDTLPDALVELFQQVEDDILRDIARRINKMSGLTSTAAWQAWRLEQTRAVYSDVVRTLAKYSGKADAEIRRILQDAGATALAADDTIYRVMGFAPSDISTNPALLNLLNAGYRQTLGSWKNLTRTTANTVTRQFEDALDRAWLQVSSGAFDYKTAVKRAVDDLAGKGIKAIRYPSGHTDTLEVAARRAVLTGVNQTVSKLQIARADEMGCDLVETTAHPGARPSHAEWRGQVFSRSGHSRKYPPFERTGYGTGAGLCGWNCRHSFYPFFEGLSDRAYSRSYLDDINARDIDYRGKKYSRYEINQQQRALERRVRAAKRKYLAEDAAGLDTSAAAAELNHARRKLDAFVHDTGGRLDSARIGVSGFGRSQAGKATWAARDLHFIKNDAIIKANSGLPKRISIPDEILKATAEVDLPNIHGVVPKGSIVSEAYVMAGSGTSTPIRDLKRLCAQYPDAGPPSGWQKKSGTIVTGNFRYVVHWYENQGNVPAAEIKTKGVRKL